MPKSLNQVGTTFEHDGLQYRITSVANQTVTIDHQETEKTGDLVIPEEVYYLYNSNKYFVTSIDNEAFLGCSGITSITIPNSVTNIGNNAFKNCSGINEVHSLIEEPFAIPANAFQLNNGSFTTATLYVPTGTKAKYQATAGWKNFARIVEEQDETTATKDLTADMFKAWDGAGKNAKIVNDPAPCPNEDGTTSDFETSFALNQELGSGETIFGHLNVYYLWYADLTGAQTITFEGTAGLQIRVLMNRAAPTADDTDPHGGEMTEYKLIIEDNGKAELDVSSLEFVHLNAIKTDWNSPSGMITKIQYSTEGGETTKSITFTDAEVKRLCVQNWDTNGDGELSEDEAAAVTDLEEVFKENHNIKSFNELKYFTGLTAIGDYAFFGCSNLTAITIPNSVTYIDSQAFGYCWSLTAIIIPNSVTRIESNAFNSCSSLTSITIPNSVTSIGGNAFWECASITSIVVEGGNPAYDSRNNCNAIINTSNNELITGCKTTIIPNSVTSIGVSAFYGCSGLTSITIPNNVTSIERYAFGDCTGLQEVHSQIQQPFAISENVFSTYDATTLYVPAGTKAKYQATEGWKNFANIVEEGGETTKNITFADAEVKRLCVQNWDTNGDGELSEDEAAAVTDLGEVFKNNKTIKTFNELQYFTGLTAIGEDAISGCDYLTSITIPNNVTSIGNYAFYRCTGLTSITIPNFVTSIGNGAFEFCSGLTSITIPNSVTSIGSDAFRYCYGLTSITIPNSVTSIGNDAFHNCSSLTSITIPNNVTNIGNSVFYGCSSLTSITIPNSVTSIEYGAFRNCSSLTSVTIPNSVTSIGSWAFYGCSGLTSVTIPNSVTSIGEKAFAGCTGLKEVQSLIQLPFAIPDDVFNIYDTATLHVPAGTKAKYQATDGWKNFKNIIQEGGDPDDVTLTAKSYTREYGEENPTFGYEVTSGTITSGQPTLSCAATKTSPVGTYDIVIQTGTVSNKAVNLVKGTLTITKAPLTISAGSYTKEEGQDNPEFTLTYTGFKNGETKSVLTKQPTVSCNATKNSPAGTYTVTVSGAEAQNYHINYVNGSLTITPKPVVSKNITFADAEVKRICIQNWDTNGDGELSEAEATAVTDLGTVFKDNKTIRTFHELKYFTNLNSIKDYAFQGCSNLTEMTIPAIITSVGENAFNDAGLLSLIWESNTSLTAKQVERLKEARPNILIFVKDEDVMPSKGIDNVVINGVAESLVLTENSPFHSIQTFTAQSATFSHRFTMETGKGASAGWETIALPFDVQVYRHESKGEVVPFAKYTEGSKAKPFWLYRLTSGGFVEAQAIEANKPYLISMPNNAAYFDEDCLNGKVQFTASSVTIKRTDEAEMTNVSYEGKTLRPTFAAVDRGSTVYAINATGDFSTATGGGTAGSLFVRDLRAVRPFEAYFDSGSANAREFITINFADETATGIDSTFDVPRSMVNGQRSMVNVYNMAGQLVYSGSTEGLNAMKQQLPAGLYVVSSANGVSRVRAY